MSTQTTTLAEALLRRKELNGIIARLEPIRVEGMFVTRIKRQNVMDGVDQVTAAVPRITADQVDAYYNWAARQLRLIDAAIQKANWETQVTVSSTVLADYEGRGLPEDTHPDSVTRLGV